MVVHAKCRTASRRAGPSPATPGGIQTTANNPARKPRLKGCTVMHSGVFMQFATRPRRAFTLVSAVAGFLGALIVPASAAAIHTEPFCAAAQTDVVTYYAELQKTGGRNYNNLASAAERAASDLSACARQHTAPTMLENDRLYIRAADASFVASEARHHLGQNDGRLADLRAVLKLVSFVDSRARTRSNTSIYREARLLQRFARPYMSDMRYATRLTQHVRCQSNAR
jgi:hypothetical protein